MVALAPPELDHIPASAYHNLLHYHYLCGEAAKGVTASMRWIPTVNDYVWFSCNNCGQGPLAWYLTDDVIKNVRVWFNAYLTRVGDIVAQTPGMDIDSHESLYEALKTAAECSNCCTKVFAQFPLWVKTALKPQMQKVIEQIKLKF
ncbi:hypothetical protein K438DRAFT_1987623 [Mycena galopus ATCC 62051]|nr:hypothetical protein K438DRAFT_1987623 [Mycena galopus ATCC 62051]